MFTSKNHGTKWTSTEVQENTSIIDGNKWYYIFAGYDISEVFDNYPTDEEIKAFIDEVTK